MECATDEPNTPIKQDTKKGKLRFYPYNINWKLSVAASRLSPTPSLFFFRRFWPRRAREIYRQPLAAATPPLPSHQPSNQTKQLRLCAHDVGGPQPHDPGPQRGGKLLFLSFVLLPPEPAAPSCMLAAQPALPKERNTFFTHTTIFRPRLCSLTNRHGFLQV